MYTILSLVGIGGEFELMTNIGRLDCAVELTKSVYIFEFKLNSTSSEGLEQIKEKKYYEKYQNRGKKIFMVGVAFDKEEKNIKDWQLEII